jgi:hypothetical protein
MKKLIIFVMSLALICGSVYAGSTFRFAATDDGGVVVEGDGKYTDDPEVTDPDSPRGPPCNSLTPCGIPTETEGNNTCGNPDVTALSCGSTIYGKACEDDDYFVLNIPGYNTLVITLFDGANCGRNPAVYARMKPYNNSPMNCDPLPDAVYVNDFLEFENNGFDEVSVKIRVRRDHDENTTYSLVVACETIQLPCPNGTRNYCEDPIIVPVGLPLVDGYYHYENTENSCCAENIVSCVHDGGGYGTCEEGSCYASGPGIVYKLGLSEGTTIRIETGIAGGGDTQFMVVTDCTDPNNTCLASVDYAPYPYNDPEILAGLTLPAGFYYIITTKYGQGACDGIYIKIDGDDHLPVELTGFDAVAGDGEVTLNWSTASETNTDYFDVLRDGVTMSRIDAANSVTGYSYAWTDANLTNGREYAYDLVSVGMDGTRENVGAVSATPTVNAATVTEYALHQNYPNPFNPETSIMFDVMEATDVKLTVFNPLGQTVATLVNGAMESGRHTVTFDGSRYTSGLYYYRLEAGDFTAIRKMILMK